MQHDERRFPTDPRHPSGEARSPEERQHEALCALALGELGRDEARALEARLRADAALAAEYDGVRATIELVRESLSGSEALPPAHLERILSVAREAASPPHRSGGPVASIADATPTPWHRRPAIGLAASVVALAGASFFALRVLDGEGSPSVETTSEDVGLAARSALDEGEFFAVDGVSEYPASAPAGSPAEAELVEELTELERSIGELAAGETAVRERARDGVEASLRSARAKVADELADREAPAADPRAPETYFAKGEAPPPGAVTGVNERAIRQQDTLQLGAPLTELAGAEGPTGAAAQPGAAGSVLRLDAPALGAVDKPGGTALEKRSGEIQLGFEAFSEPKAVELDVRAQGEALTRGYTTASGLGGGAGGAVDRGAPASSPARPSGERSEKEARARAGAVTATPEQDFYSKAPAGGGGYVGPEGTASPGTPLHLARPEGERDASRSLGAATGNPDASATDDFDLAMGERLREFADGGGNPRLTAAEIDARAQEVWHRFRDDCLPRPGERPRDMYFRFWGDNAFVETKGDALSTFAADVDTASYALARRYLREGVLPEKAQIRTEEFVNAFTPDLPAPAEDTFGLHLELAPSPFGGHPSRWLVRAGIRGKEVAKDERQPLDLTFVVDTSGSMREGNRLELVKHAMRLLVTQLEARDRIAIVAYSNEARQILLPTSAAERNLIESAIHPLQPSGSTNAEAGLKMGYALAESVLSPGRHNRVVFLSDGVANVGQTDQDRLAMDVSRFSDAGIYLNTIGVGMNNHNDVFLEQLADKGDGICDYVDDAKAAEHAIVARFSGAFVPIASDVKLQLEFDPRTVLRWRQLGYENRAIADQDFRNDAVDAGEVGAGHQVTCLYEVELAEDAGVAGAESPLAKLRVRWKAPKAAGQDAREVDVFEREASLAFGAGSASFEAASPGFRRAALAAEFAEFLRRSSHARNDSYAALGAGIGALIDASPRGGTFLEELAELADLVRRADGLGLGYPAPVSELDRMLEAYRRYQYLRATMQGLDRSEDDSLRRLEETNRMLEEQIRDRIRRNLAEKHG